MSKRKMSWVLKNFSVGPKGKPLFFRCMTAIGPACTDKPDEAEHFATEREAMRHPAYSFGLCTFEPHNLEPR